MVQINWFKGSIGLWVQLVQEFIGLNGSIGSSVQLVQGFKVLTGSSVPWFNWFLGLRVPMVQGISRFKG